MTFIARPVRQGTHRCWCWRMRNSLVIRATLCVAVLVSLVAGGEAFSWRASLTFSLPARYRAAHKRAHTPVRVYALRVTHRRKHALDLCNSLARLCRRAGMQGGARLRMAGKPVPTACRDKVCVPLDKDERGTQADEADPLLLNAACGSPERRWSGDGLFKRCELWVRSLRVFWTAFRLFVDYKILQWRTNQMSEEQSEESDRMWEAVRVLTVGSSIQ